ncbi:protein-export chaperone SecB [Actinomadura sp. WMMB 499]|uniref:protein-export chaperone SecB n=1 Tax=Actinomadura sp. WMMB 499 TaxID=1219491 RepID=UPI001245C30C|nr:protein-export chaperone SecB [Actinomadura sp. WMMB 499]QFG21239.1 protein-export chaperone SecB [Actinomadura sp. WMMB 499]
MTRTTVGELREIAQNILQYIEIEDINMRSLSITGTHPVLEGPFTVSTTLSVSGEMRADHIDLFTRYDIRAMPANDDDEREEHSLHGDDKEENAWRLKLILVATFAKQSAKIPSFSDEDLKALAYAFGPLFMHPYAREIVQHNVTRLGYPPYTLSILEPLTTADDEEVEIKEG